MIKGDVIYAFVAIGLIALYCSVFLGSCSPIHCRLSLALVGIFCVILSCTTGEALSYVLGWKVSDFNSVLPVLMLGIGVDDMFVICNAIDQTSFKLPYE